MFYSDVVQRAASKGQIIQQEEKSTKNYLGITWYVRKNHSAISRNNPSNTRVMSKSTMVTLLYLNI